MKKATLIIWAIIFGVIALLIFQNKAFFLTNQSLQVNLGIIEAYHTPELPIDPGFIILPYRNRYRFSFQPVGPFQSQTHDQKVEYNPSVSQR